MDENQNVVEELETPEEETIEEEVVEEPAEEPVEDDEEQPADDEGAGTRAQSQIDRLKAKLADKDEEIADLKGKIKPKKPAKPTESTDTSRLDRIDLKLAGVKHKDDQDFVLDYVKMNEKSIDEALESKFVKTGLATLRKERRESASGQPPNNRTGGGSEDATIRKAVQHYKKTGDVMDGLTSTQTRKLMNIVKNT